MWRKYTKLIGLCLKCLGKSEMEQALLMTEYQQDMIVRTHRRAVRQITQGMYDNLLGHHNGEVSDEASAEYIEQAISNIATVDKEAKSMLDAVGIVESAMTTETTRIMEDTHDHG